MKKNAKVTLFRLLISLLLIGVLIKTQNIKRIKGYVLGFNFFILTLGILLNLLGTYFSTLRWQTILKASKRSVNLGLLYRLYVKAYFYNNFMPTQMGGDVYKSIVLGKKLGKSTNDNATAMFSVFADRFSGVIVLVSISLLGLGSVFGWKGIIIAVSMLAFSLIAYNPGMELIIKLSPAKPLTKFVSKFKEASDLALSNRPLAAKTLFFALLVQICSFLWTYMYFWGLGIKIPIKYVFAFFPLVSLSLALPISFNGLGSQELIYAYLFTTIGISQATSITVSVLLQVQRLAMSLIGGLLVLLKK